MASEQLCVRKTPHASKNLAAVNATGSVKKSEGLSDVRSRNPMGLLTSETLVNELKTQFNLKLASDRVGPYGYGNSPRLLFFVGSCPALKDQIKS
ncbi:MULTISPECIES: hypothetical protein [Sphingobacterium]|uniref:hypothetical protein n=1 Tax=Sphingobacterium TaxID=28453 RepID=UPI00257D5321|nr:MULTISPECIES: hypothetical protein [Sphingobacterium]